MIFLGLSLKSKSLSLKRVKSLRNVTERILRNLLSVRCQKSTMSVRIWDSWSRHWTLRRSETVLCINSLRLPNLSTPKRATEAPTMPVLSSQVNSALRRPPYQTIADSKSLVNSKLIYIVVIRKYPCLCWSLKKLWSTMTMGLRSIYDSHLKHSLP